MSTKHNAASQAPGRVRLLPALLCAGMLLAAGAASAAVVTSRGALGGTDYIDWAQLGPDSTELVGPTAVTSALGAAATVDNPAGSFFRFDEGGGTFVGNFSAGDALLHTFGSAGPLVIDFATAQSRVGAQIQANIFQDFTGVLQVFDALNNLLETVTLGGTGSFSPGDNSAIFLGVARASADIDHISFSITGPSELDFAINQLDFTNRVGTTNPVPEPSGLALVSVAFLGLLGAGRSRRRQD